ncbi:benzoate 4-monooxygenase cytochrome-like protein P450 [Teratosphaeria nubilosa]|uniref:Benzoate 4-monooxygenase cytochrome-like protein P450 n=1 Tax=Teratosphaeria nubilosa TaxID=161662 RepID=A0A6G1LBH1_9PEZI|nr:benzoate 4-monooxygenase cytochrome-like protein P450 [Teratosphaeria nubilosa]
MSYSHLLLLGSILTTLLYVVVYRLYFHPLAKYPGPFWARLTAWPSWWHTIKQDRHLWLYSLQEKYGTTFRYRPDAVLVNTPTAFRTIFGLRGNVKKSDDYYRLWPKTVEIKSTWNVTDYETHARKRRVLNYAFSEKALRAAEPAIQANVDRWLDLFEKYGESGKKSFNMAHEINYLVFDILGDLCFSKSFEMMAPESEGAPIREVPELLAQFLAMMHPIAFAPWAKWWLWLRPRGLDWLLTKAAPPAAKKWESFVNKCLTERTQAELEAEAVGKKESEKRKDFFHWLWDAVDPVTGKTGYSRDELYGEMELLIIAGSDTSSIAMAGMIFYLARNPEVQDKLAKEIRSVFSSYDEIQGGAKLQSCKYLRAFLHEGCRMSGPIPAEPARTVLPGGTQVDDQWFPEGTKVSVGFYCLSNNKDVYPEPFKFRPERWIADENDPKSVAQVQQAEAAFCAFSAGSRGCVGKNLAWLEMLLVIAKLVYRFQVKQDPGNNLGGGSPDGRPGRREENQYQLFEAFVALRDGPVVQLLPRK